jgi:hypothetical protein
VFGKIYIGIGETQPTKEPGGTSAHTGFPLFNNLQEIVMSNDSRNVRFESDRDIVIKSKSGKPLLTLKYRKPHAGIDAAGNRHYIEISPEYQVGVTVR